MGLFPPLRPNFDAALRDVASANPRMREAAAEALSTPPEGRAREAVEALRPLVDDPVASVRAQAMSSLGRLGDPEALEGVLARFEDQDPTVRQVALIAAAEIGGEAALRALRGALRSDAPEVRFQAVASLASLAPPGAARDLARLADDPDVEVRAHLADALGALEDAAGADTLAGLLADRAVKVRRAAAVALGRLGDARAVDGLIDALRDDERFFEAAWALAELGAEAAREPLASVAASFLKPLAFKAAAAAALVRLGDERGIPALRGVLRALRWEARSYAVELVGELEALELADEVVALASRPRGADLVVVARALGRLAPTHEGAREALRALSKRNDEAGATARSLLET